MKDKQLKKIVKNLKAGLKNPEIAKFNRGTYIIDFDVSTKDDGGKFAMKWFKDMVPGDPASALDYTSAIGGKAQVTLDLNCLRILVNSSDGQVNDKFVYPLTNIN